MYTLLKPTEKTEIGRFSNFQKKNSKSFPSRGRTHTKKMDPIEEILSLYEDSSTKSRKNVKIFNTIFKLITTRELRDSEFSTFQNPTLYEIVDEARVDAFVRNFFVLFRTQSFTINSTFIRTAGIGI